MPSIEEREAVYRGGLCEIKAIIESYLEQTPEDRLCYIVKPLYVAVEAALVRGEKGAHHTLDENHPAVQLLLRKLEVRK